MTDTTPAHETHAEALTAEVRTLVVGTRQITTTIYAQLDDVPPGDIEPIGRVGFDDRIRFIAVIGRQISTGALARSYLPRHPESLRYDGLLHTVGKTFRQYAHWDASVNVEQQRQHLAELADRWAELPLIILAALR